MGGAGTGQGALNTKASAGKGLSSQVAIPHNAFCIKQRASSTAKKITAQARLRFVPTAPPVFTAGLIVQSLCVLFNSRSLITTAIFGAVPEFGPYRSLTMTLVDSSMFLRREVAIGPDQRRSGANQQSLLEGQFDLKPFCAFSMSF